MMTARIDSLALIETSCWRELQQAAQQMAMQGQQAEIAKTMSEAAENEAQTAAIVAGTQLKALEAGVRAGA